MTTDADLGGPEHADKQQSGESERPARVVGRPWAPGSSGNPAGRPRKNEAFTDRLRYYAENFTARELAAINAQGLTVKDAMAVRQLRRALGTKGMIPVVATRDLYDRLDGRARQTVDVNTDTEERHDAIRDAFLAGLVGADPDALAAELAAEELEELPDE